MAENYSVKQVVEIIKNGSVSERVDVSRRYPILPQVALSLPDFAVDMLNAVKYCNARKIDRYYQDFLNGEVRYNALKRANPAKADRLFALNEQEAMERYDYLKKLVDVYAAEKE